MENKIIEINDNNIDVLLVNEKLKEYKSRRKAAKELNLSKRKLKREMKVLGYKYDRILKRYVSNMRGAIGRPEGDMRYDDTNNIGVIPNEEMKDKLVDLLSEYDKIKAIITEYDNKYDESIIEADIRLVADEKWVYKRTTFELDESVLEEFNNLCKNKFKYLSKRELNTIAIQQCIKNNQ